MQKHKKEHKKFINLKHSKIPIKNNQKNRQKQTLKDREQTKKINRKKHTLTLTHKNSPTKNTQKHTLTTQKTHIKSEKTHKRKLKKTQRHNEKQNRNTLKKYTKKTKTNKLAHTKKTQ